MRNLLTLFAVLSLPCLMPAQSWEVGADAGYGFYRHADVTAGSVTGKTGFENGAAFGAVLGNQFHSIVGGEARYTFQMNDLMVSVGSAKATATGQSHALHYDVLIHANRPGAAVRPFVAAGAGVKFFRGTGDERVFQQFSNLVALSHTHEAQPLISVGGGMKFKAGKHALVRFDFRDYLTPVPSGLLATPPSSRVKGWMHDFVFLMGISSVF